MYTGIIEEVGQLKSRDDGRFVFAASSVLEDTKIDDSISVSGICLTVVELGENWFGADATEETLSRTTLGRLQPGDQVNLERPVRVSDRLGGHIVQGHVDGIGEVVVPAPNMRVLLAPELCKYIVEKGSVTVDGISLTVVDALDDGFTVALIPHTIEVTTIGNSKAGDLVNIEIDVLARYAERILTFSKSG